MIHNDCIMRLFEKPESLVIFVLFIPYIQLAVQLKVDSFIM